MSSLCQTGNLTAGIAPSPPLARHDQPVAAPRVGNPKSREIPRKYRRFIKYELCTFPTSTVNVLL